LRDRDPGHHGGCVSCRPEAELTSALDVDRGERCAGGPERDLQNADRHYLAVGECTLVQAFAADPSSPSPLHSRMSAAALLAMFGVIVADGDARMAAEPDPDVSQDAHLLDDALRFLEAGLHEVQPSDARSSATPATVTRGS
jgi:hypothetical protein